MVERDETLFGKNKAIKMPLTRRFHGNLLGTHTEFNLGLIVLLSTNQTWVILLSVL